jgi:hypothetical protein
MIERSSEGGAKPHCFNESLQGHEAFYHTRVDFRQNPSKGRDIT